MGVRLEREARLRRDGLIDPALEKLADQRQASIDEILDVYEKVLRGRRTTAKHVSLTLSRIRKVVNGCEFKILSDIAGEAVEEFLGEMTEADGSGHKTYNHYVQSFDGFCRWLVSSKRSGANPVVGLTRLNTEVDIRHKRRALNTEEFSKLIQSARESGEDIQCFSGEERSRIYILSAFTGLRRKEIASLTPRSFALTTDPPTLTVEAACSKHRKEDVLPIHPQLVVLIRKWIAGVPPDQILFPKLAKRRTWLMVKKDLERVGIAYETPEGIADFHAAGRHTYITSLLKSGASLPETKELARHSDVNMTMRYAHIGIQDQANAVAGLPFWECIGSKTVTAAGHSVTSADTPDTSAIGTHETTNPGVNRGYVILCRSLASNDAQSCQWRRRESNPRPENLQVGPLRV